MKPLKSNPHLPASGGFVKIQQILGDPARNIPALIPGRTTFYKGVKQGKYPHPIKLSERTSVWLIDEIWEAIDRVNNPKKQE